MIASQAKLAYRLNDYYTEKTVPRKAVVTGNVLEAAKIVTDILKGVETQEPRFISSLTESNGRLEGIEVISPTEFHVSLYLNQMGVFNFVDDGSVPGCAVLKLSDGRKRSMSLWVEFITASGYLSARKVRSRFQTLVAHAIERSNYRSCVKMVTDTSEVKLRINDNFVVQMTPAFKCTGIWPRSAAHWPSASHPWSNTSKVAQVKAEGFNLLSKQIPYSENRNRHLDFPGSSLNNYHMKTLVLYECDKHPRDDEWSDICIGDRLVGILLQLISCLQCRRFPHYFVPAVDLLAGTSASFMDSAAKVTWQLAREIITNSGNLENL